MTVRIFLVDDVSADAMNTWWTGNAYVNIALFMNWDKQCALTTVMHGLISCWFAIRHYNILFTLNSRICFKWHRLNQIRFDTDAHCIFIINNDFWNFICANCCWLTMFTIYTFQFIRKFGVSSSIDSIQTPSFSTTDLESMLLFLW